MALGSPALLAPHRVDDGGGGGAAALGALKSELSVAWSNALIDSNAFITSAAPSPSPIPLTLAAPALSAPATTATATTGTAADHPPLLPLSITPTPCTAGASNTLAAVSFISCWAGLSVATDTPSARVRESVFAGAGVGAGAFESAGVGAAWVFVDRAGG